LRNAIAYFDTAAQFALLGRIDSGMQSCLGLTLSITFLVRQITTLMESRAKRSIRKAISAAI
jgi:hypothetical protein